MRILEEFWYGNINPNEQSFDKQSRFGKVMSLLTVKQNALKSWKHFVKTVKN